MVFRRTNPRAEATRADIQSELVARLIDASDEERREFLLDAVQTGHLGVSEAADLLRLVERLALISQVGVRPAA